MDRRVSDPALLARCAGPVQDGEVAGAPDRAGAKGKGCQATSQRAGAREAKAGGRAGAKETSRERGGECDPRARGERQARGHSDAVGERHPEIVLRRLCLLAQLHLRFRACHGGAGDADGDGANADVDDAVRCAVDRSDARSDDGGPDTDARRLRADAPGDGHAAGLGAQEAAQRVGRGDGEFPHEPRQQ